MLYGMLSDYAKLPTNMSLELYITQQQFTYPDWLQAACYLHVSRRNHAAWELHVACIPAGTCQLDARCYFLYTIFDILLQNVGSLAKQGTTFFYLSYIQL